MALQNAAVVAAQNNFGRFGLGCRTELTFSAAPHNLHGSFGNRRQAHVVGLRKLSAGRIHRHSAARLDCAVLEPVAPFARFEKTVILKRNLHGVGKTIVDLAGIHRVERDAGHGKGRLFGRPGAGGSGHPVRLNNGRRGIMHSHSHDDGRRLLQVARPFKRGHDNGPSAVGNQAIVWQAQRFDNPSGAVVIRFSQWLVVQHGGRVEGGPLALAHGDFFPGFRTRAEFVHRPSGGKRVAAGGAEMTEDGIVS